MIEKVSKELFEEIKEYDGYEKYNFVLEDSQFNNVDRNVLMALLNPLTRELAEKKYVEKESKYKWKTKKSDITGHKRVLAKDKRGAVYFLGYCLSDGHTVEIKESELKEWGYNPDMFDKFE